MGDKVLSLANLSKNFPGTGLASEIVALPDDIIWIPSSFLAYNYQLGGGVPYGKIMEVFGAESSGKTLSAIDLARATITLGGMVIWDDAEQAFTFEWAEKNGLDLTKILISNSTLIEEVSDWLAESALAVRSLLVNNEPILFVCDSVAALDCSANINAKQVDEKAEMGNRAKALYKMVRIRNQMLSDLGITSVYINQLRDNVKAGMFQDPETTPAGKAMRFFASIRIGFYGSKPIKVKRRGVEIPVGREVSIRVKKNKVAPSRPTIKGAEIYFQETPDYEVGFNRYKGLTDILYRERILNRTSEKGSFTFEGISIGKSLESADYFLADDDNAGIRGRILKSSNINTISKTRKKIEALTYNKFPVKSKTFKRHEDESGDTEE